MECAWFKSALGGSKQQWNFAEQIDFATVGRNTPTKAGVKK